MNTNKNVAESLKLQKAVKAKARQCYINAARVIWDVPGYQMATYVEGIALAGGLPIEHGWVEQDGELLDPTLPKDNLIYFSGLRFEGEQGIAKAMQLPKSSSDDLPFFYRFGWGGCESPEFREAWNQAKEMIARLDESVEMAASLTNNVNDCQ